jgi:alkyl hydroperoxide reductase subunit AhpC
LCQKQLVQLHENIEQFNELGIKMYIVSGDQSAQQKELYEALESRYDNVLPFISDPDLVLIEKMGMKNNDIAYRGYALLDQEGNLVLSKKNDHWGEQIDQTYEDVVEELENLQN